MMETPPPNPSWSAPAIILLPDGRNADTGFSSLFLSLCAFIHSLCLILLTLSHTHPASDSVRVCAIRKRIKGDYHAG